MDLNAVIKLDGISGISNESSKEIFVATTKAAVHHDVVGNGDDGILWREVCYHEPKVHDHDLYHRLNAANLYILLPLGILGLSFNAVAFVSIFILLLFM